MPRRRVSSRKECTDSTKSSRRSSAKISMGFRLDVSMTTSEGRPFPLEPPPRPLPPLPASRQKHSSRPYELDKLKPPPPLPPSIFGPNGSLLRHCSKKRGNRSPAADSQSTRTYPCGVCPPAAIPMMPPHFFGKSTGQATNPFWPHTAYSGSLVHGDGRRKRKKRHRSARRRRRSARSPSCSTCTSSDSFSYTSSSTYSSSRSCSGSCSCSSVSDRRHHKRSRKRRYTKKRSKRVARRRERSTRHKRRHARRRLENEEKHSDGHTECQKEDVEVEETGELDPPNGNKVDEPQRDDQHPADEDARSSAEEDDEELKALAEKKKELLKQLAQLEEIEASLDVEEPLDGE